MKNEENMKLRDHGFLPVRVGGGLANKIKWDKNEYFHISKHIPE